MKSMPHGHEAHAKNRRTGRRSGKPDTRTLILTAARELFAEKGFTAATMRAIALKAEVDVSLIPHYFGDKQGLFDAVQKFPIDVLNEITKIFDGPLEGMGLRLTRTYLGLWEDPGIRPQLKALMRSVMLLDDERNRIRDALNGSIFTNDPKINEQSRKYIGYAISQLLGVALMRHISEIPALTGPSFDELVADVAPLVQVHINRVANEGCNEDSINK